MTPLLLLLLIVLPIETISLSSTAPSTRVKPSASQENNHKKLFPFQQEGVDRLVKDKRLLLADEMGLGKTVQCIQAMNQILSSTRKKRSRCFNILVVCPKSVVSVWEYELSQWLQHEAQVSIAAAGKKTIEFDEENQDRNTPRILLINYDICHKHKNELQKIDWHVLICDEAHYLKSLTTKRTLAVLGDGSRAEPGISAKYLWLLTGTPIMNRPVELYPLLQAIAPKDFDDFDEYCDRYCDPVTRRVGRKGYIKDVSGASNLSELSKRLKPLMLRRYKNQVLSQLPPKLRSCHCLTTTSSNKENVAQQEQEFLQQVLHENGIKSMGQFALGSNVVLSDILDNLDGSSSNKIMGLLATVRRETAMGKVEPAIELLKEVIQSHKVVVFCHHRQLITNLMEAFGPEIAVHVMGGMDSTSRAEAVRRFQNDDHVKIFIGSIRAAGVGLTLTAASHVIFLELDWSPAVMSQAEDRCHRVGQQDSVHVQYYVFQDTIDEMLARTLVTKQMDIDRVLNKRATADTTSKEEGGTYVLDFGKHKGVPFEDVPSGYLQFLVNTPDIWKKRPALWRSLFQQGLVEASPPPLMADKNPRKKLDDEMHKAVNYEFDFGKHNGMSWMDVPLSYREWVIRERVWNNNPTLRAALSDAGLIEAPAAD